MKKRTNWLIGFGIALLTLALILLGVHYIIFDDIHWLEKYVVFELAFLPIEVVVVTLILDQLLEARERKERLEKMNMVIGLFFSEVGLDLIREVASHDIKVDGIRANLANAGGMSAAEFNRLKSTLAGYQYRPELGAEDLAGLKQLLASHRGFLVRMLENPILMEHEEFTESLRAVFHLAEELGYRKDLSQLPASDVAHLTGDVKRAYGKLVLEWLSYMRYLKSHYPYLYSLTLRTNPFDMNASVVVSS